MIIIKWYVELIWLKKSNSVLNKIPKKNSKFFFWLRFFIRSEQGALYLEYYSVTNKADGITNIRFGLLIRGRIDCRLPFTLLHFCTLVFLLFRTFILSLFCTFAFLDFQSFGLPNNQTFQPLDFRTCGLMELCS